MTGFLAMVRVTLRQLLGGKRLVLFGLLATLPGAVTWFATANRTTASVIDQFHEVLVGTLYLVVIPITALIFGSSSLGDERRDGTLPFLVLRPRPRTSITGAKLLAAWIAGTAVSGGAGVVAAVIAAGRAGDASFVAPTLLGASLATLAYTAVFLVVGHITGRAVLVGLVYVFVWENGITFGAPALANISLFRIGLSAHLGLVPDALPSVGDALGSVTPGAGGAIVKALVIAAAGVAAAAAILRRRDLL